MDKQSSWFYDKDAKMGQNAKINKYNILHHIKNKDKLYNYKKCRKTPEKYEIA